MLSPSTSPLTLFFLLLLLFNRVSGISFQFDVKQSGQCGPLTVSWSGGKGPFTATIHPMGGASQTYNVPDSSVSGNKGVFNFTLPVAQGNQFVITMGDSTDPFAGGTSLLFTAGAPASTAPDCTTTSSPYFHWKAATDTINQCSPFSFTDISASNSSAPITFPVTILGLKPAGGAPVQLHVSEGATSFDWTVDVASGRKIAFDLIDSQGHQGGVSPNVFTIGAGSNNCLTQQASSSGSSGELSQPSQPSTSLSAASSQKALSGGAIAGIIIGVLIFIIISVLCALFLWKRRGAGNKNHVNYRGDVEGSTPRPFMAHRPTTSFGTSVGTTFPTKPTTGPPFDDYRTEYSASTYYGEREGMDQEAVPVVFHRDIADNPRSVEFPPQYSSSREPIWINTNVGGITPGGMSTISTSRTDVKRKEPPRF